MRGYVNFRTHRDLKDKYYETAIYAGMTCLAVGFCLGVFLMKFLEGR